MHELAAITAGAQEVVSDEEEIKRRLWSAILRQHVSMERHPPLEEDIARTVLDRLPMGVIMASRSSNWEMYDTIRNLTSGHDSDCALSTPRPSGLAPLSVLVVPVGGGKDARRWCCSWPCPKSR